MGAGTDRWSPSFEASGYRDSDHLARRRLAELLTRGQEQLRGLTELARLHGRRTGRIAGGATATLLGLAFLITSIFVERGDRGGRVTLLLLASAWGLGLLAAAIGRVLGRQSLLHQARELVRPSGDLHRDLARLEALGQTRAPGRPGPGHAAPGLSEVLAARTSRLEAASLALPLTAVALLTPLTAHLPFAFGTNGLSGIDLWCRASAVIVGHAHLVLAGLFVRHAIRIRRASEPLELRTAGWRILALTVAAAAVPGIVLFGLPPILTAVTGAVFIPYAAALAVDRAIAEREQLSLAVPGPTPAGASA
jgi:hypothetical protein